jgi:hypothetical protein
MTRSFIAGLCAAVAVAVLSGTGCQDTGVGDPCTPEEEYSQTFLGFNVGEVSVEADSFQCRTRLCLVNHFQGRVSCPYGQNADGSNVSGTQSCATAQSISGTGTTNYGCCTPGVDQPINGLIPGTQTEADSVNMATVPPQCSNRTAADAVYCSCRCANVNNQTNDGFNYCTCPDGFSCTQLISSIGGVANQGLTGAYCVKNGTVFDPNNGCPECTTSPTPDCGNAQGVQAGH